MSLINGQALITVTVTPSRFAEAADKMRAALEPYPDARIISVTRSTNWFGFVPKVTLLVAVEYSPHDTESR